MKHILRLWHILDITTQRIALPVAFISFVGVIILLVNVPWHFSYCTQPEFWATLIGTTVAISNALLLYATLRSQNESIVNTKEAHGQERFETTFFNLLDYQRRLTEEIVINYEKADGNANISFLEARGRESFSFANNEIRQISESLKSDISATYNYDDILPNWEKLKEELVGDDKNGNISEDGIAKLKEFRNNTNIKHHNLVYSINDEERQCYLYDQTIPYKLFMKKWGVYFECYIRSIECILQYMCEEYQLDERRMQKYTTFLQVQMNKDELQFIETHAQSFSYFGKMLNKTHLTEILTHNKI